MNRLKYIGIVLATVAAAPFAQGQGAKIAFASSRDGNSEIYIMNADGSGQVRLTNNAATDFDPAFSIDGSQIVFQSDRDGNDEIYVMSADGSDQTRLTNNPALDFDPAFSPDGSRIVFTSNRDGSWDVYTMNADGSGVTNLTNGTSVNHSAMFSPDGTKIAFYSHRDGNAEVYIMNADGSGQTNLTGNAANDGDPAFSPDGNLIAFQSNRDGNFEIYVMNVDGSGQTRITTNAATDLLATFNPDSSQLAFQSDRDGNDEIYVINVDGSGLARLTNNAVFDGVPSFPLAPGTTALPDSYSLFRGILTGGGLADLFTSDDSWMTVQPGITLSNAERPVQLILRGTAPTDSPTELRFRLEAHADINGIGQWIELWNYDTNSYDLVDFMIATTVDSIVEVSIVVVPERYIEAGTLQMKARVSYKEAGPVISYPWLISFDETVWIIVE